MDDDVLEGREPKWTEFALPEEFKKIMVMRRLKPDSKNSTRLREARQEGRVNGGLDNDQEEENAEESMEDYERKENEEEKEPNRSEDMEESEGAKDEVEDGTVGDEEEMVERTKNLEVTENIEPTPRRRGNRLSGIATIPRLPPIGNFAPPIRGRGGTQRRRARGRGRLGNWGSTMSTRGSRSEEATPAKSENLSEAPNSSSQNTEDTGETTEEEDPDSGKGSEEEVEEDHPLVPTTLKRGGVGGQGRGRGRGRARGGSSASTAPAVVELDSVRRSIRNK